MKTVKTTLIVLATICMLVGCKKDENGNYVTYYKNKTVTGYLYGFYNVDSIAMPINNYKIYLSANLGGGTELFPSPEHIDYCYTDENGKFTFYFVKTINSHKVAWWQLGYHEPEYGHWHLWYPDEIQKINNIDLDTMFYYINK